MDRQGTPEIYPPHAHVEWPAPFKGLVGSTPPDFPTTDGGPFMAQLLSAAAHDLSGMCCARAGSVRAESVVVTLIGTGDDHMVLLRMRAGYGGCDAVRSCRHSVGRTCTQKADALLASTPPLGAGDGALHLEHRLNRLPCHWPAKTAPNRLPLSVAVMDGGFI